MQNSNNDSHIILHPLLEPFAVICVATINTISRLSLILYLIGVPPFSLFDDPPE